MVKKSNLYYYGVAFYGFILMFLMYTIVKSLHSLFLVPVTEDLGMERCAFSLVFTITGLALAAALPVVTRLLKRYSAKWIILVCIVMTAGGFAAFSLAGTIWQFYLLALIVGCGTAGCTNMVVSLLINNWFASGRASVLGLAMTGSGFGVAVLSPVLTFILESFSWQTAYLFSGLLMGAVCLPMTFLFACQRPAERGMEPYRGNSGMKVQSSAARTSKAEDTTGPSLEEIRGKAFFWVYLGAMFFWCVAIGGVHQHLAAYLTDLGHSAGFVSLVYSVVAFCIVGGKLVVGPVFDKKGTRAGALFLIVSFAIAMICLLLAEQPVLAIAFAVFYGGGSIFTTVGIPNLASGFFGQRNYADILSMTNVAYVIGAAVGPYISGKVFDITGSYQPIFAIYFALFLASAIVTLYLQSYLNKRYRDEWFGSVMQ